MNAVAWFYRSTIGKKVVMAVTGLIMIGWLLAHLAGNLQVFMAPEWIDSYAEHIHNLGPLLWVMRIGLIGVIGLHIWSAIAVTRISQAARPVDYQGGRKAKAATVAGRLMRIGGVAILFFIVWHIMDLTLGWVHPDFQVQEGGAAAAYHNLTTSLARPAIAVFYAVSVTFVGLHFIHGIQSAVQTLGGSHPKYNALRNSLSWGFGALIILGNIAIILGALTGFTGFIGGGH